jgi:hypothetical protein
MMSGFEMHIWSFFLFMIQDDQAVAGQTKTDVLIPETGWGLF